MSYLSHDSDFPCLRDKQSLTTALPGTEGKLEAQRGKIHCP